LSYNIPAGRIFEVSEEVATQIAKIAIVDNLTLIWCPAKRNPANIRMDLIFPETRVIGLHFCRG